MADTNPANFANLPKEKIQEIASMLSLLLANKELANIRQGMGGKASHKNDGDHKKADSPVETSKDNGRDEDGKWVFVFPSIPPLTLDVGRFKPGSEAAKEAGHKGGLHAQGKLAEDESGRRADGTFKPGSDEAKEAGHKGGLAAAHANSGN